MKVEIENSVSAISKRKIAGDGGAKGRSTVQAGEIVKLRPHEAEPVDSV
ncbi:hypothetical protein HNP02_005858 [Mycobacterium sp. AZCC_0083]|nr:hypothetical protein [Mycobacterium sp. AZCC_0083]